jgi:WD40 repeat protein
VLILRGPQQPVDSLTFAPDAATLYAAYHAIGVHAWNLADHTVTPFRSAENEPIYGEFVLHPSGRWAFGRTPTTPSPAPEYNTSRVIDLQTGEESYFNFYSSQHQAIAVSPTIDQFFTTGHSQYDRTTPGASCKRLYGWTMTPSGPEYLWHRDIPINEDSIAIVPLDEHRFATTDIVAPRGPVYNNVVWQIVVVIRSTANGSPLSAIPVAERYLQQFLASPDGKQLVGRLGTALWVWDANDPARPPVTVQGKSKHWMTSRAATFHPSGRYLLLANDGQSVIAFDTNTWKPVRKWNWKVGTLRTVGVSPDGTLAAASGPRGSVVVWDWDL